MIVVVVAVVALAVADADSGRMWQAASAVQNETWLQAILPDHRSRGNRPLHGRGSFTSFAG